MEAEKELMEWEEMGMRCESGNQPPCSPDRFGVRVVLDRQMVNLNQKVVILPRNIFFKYF